MQHRLRLARGAARERDQARVVRRRARRRGAGSAAYSVLVGHAAATRPRPARRASSSPRLRSSATIEPRLRRRRGAAAGPSARSCSVHGSTTAPMRKQASIVSTHSGRLPTSVMHDVAAAARRARCERARQARRALGDLAEASTRGGDPSRASSTSARRARRRAARRRRGRSSRRYSPRQHGRSDPGARHDMAVAAAPFTEKTDEQKAITEMVRQFVDEQILPNAEHYDHEDEFPEPIVEQMKELGPVRGDDPRGVRRDGARPDDLRDDRRGALARLDLDLRRSSTRTSSAPTC